MNSSFTGNAFFGVFKFFTDCKFSKQDISGLSEHFLLRFSGSIHYLFRIQTEKYCINSFNLLKQTIKTISQDNFKTVLSLQFYLREGVSLTQEPSMWTCDACAKCGKDENLVIADD